MAPEGERRAEILDAALKVFLRYGFRKTSMDEVARAAGLSRPGLYLHFPAKDELFHATVARLLDRTLAAGRAALAGAGPLSDRVVDAFVAVHGPYVGGSGFGEHVTELVETAGQVAREPIEDHEREFRGALVDALSGVPLRSGLAPAEVAELLELVSAGAKHRADSLDAYRARLRFAVGALVGA